MLDSSPYKNRPRPLLRAVVKRLEPPPGLAGMCAGFEDGKWRAEHLANHHLNWLAEFALNEREYASVSGVNVMQALRDAARTVYTSEKYERRGEIGELLLHAVIRQEFDWWDTNGRKPNKNAGEQCVPPHFKLLIFLNFPSSHRDPAALGAN